MSVKFTSKGLADGTDDTKELEFNVTGVTTGTTRTITVPDENVDLGKMGKVLQVVPLSGTVSASTTSSSFVSSGINQGITPSSATSKILVSFHVSQVQNGAGSQELRLVIYRNGIALPREALTLVSSVQVLTSMQFVMLDSPASTAYQDYVLYFRRSGGSQGPVYLQQDYSIVLMEIGV